MNSTDLSIRTIADGVQVVRLVGDRFKTARVTVALFLPLEEETASSYALLPFLLRRCCRDYPNLTALNHRLNELYGARISADVSRVGESQALVLTANCIDSRYALAGEDVPAMCARLLGSMLFSPVLEKGCFREADVEQEKRCLTELIESEINEKRWYARHQAEKLFCEGEPYAVNRYGTLDRVRALTPKDAAEAWKNALSKARVQLIIQNCGKEETVVTAFREGFDGVAGRDPESYEVKTDLPGLENPKSKIERMAVNQSKLVLGFRTPIVEPEGDVPAMRLMTALWGGTPHSLLFKNVREKQSLCYYCAASYDRHKGLLLVDSGVEESKAEQAKEEILRQLDRIRQGDFTEEELESARLSVVNQFYSVEDLQSTLASWYLGQAGLDRMVSPGQAAEEMKEVDRNRIYRAAKTLQYRGVYMLAAKGEGTDDE